MENNIVINPNEEEQEDAKIYNTKPKVVVIMGATGSGKSRLAIDLASHFPIEIINADSMQVYEGLDVLTNKVPLHDQKGVPHHLLGTISPMVEFTAKDFRDYAIPLIRDITSRNHLPVIVGGTNYYIQALVSRFLLDESLGDTDDSCLDDTNGDKEPHIQLVSELENFSYSYESLKAIDPVAANRIHPNDHRKISQYLHLYTSSGVLPSKYLQEKTLENWGDADNLRYDCCFICVDASLPVIDKFVDQRVDQMIDSGLLKEVYDIFNPEAVYTRGLRQAIGVREFEDFLRVYLSQGLAVTSVEKLKENMNRILSTSGENPLKQLLQDAIDKVKLNTRRLVRRQASPKSHGLQMHVEIRCLEGHMSGNSINRGGVIAKEFAGLGSPESLAWMSNQPDWSLFIYTGSNHSCSAAQVETNDEQLCSKTKLNCEKSTMFGSKNHK
ncbi:hypothetical protein M8C21_008027, partial [Ambrosia artemisiifolia]